MDDTEVYGLDIHEGYTDSVTGIAYEFTGLSKRQSGGGMYDTSDPVTRDLKLYAVYEPEDDTNGRKQKKGCRRRLISLMP